ncbi:MAG: SGNH/GDSL hydrolase family protein [Actinomycetota bacterium]|nr:SGNH/GDSL hydrolase family protein [Actinomycetota bacterium]
MRVQRPGKRAAAAARFAAVRGAYGGGAVGLLGALGYGVIRAESALARRTIGEPTVAPPDPTGTYGRHRGPPLRLVMIGDSSAAGLGCDVAAQTPGALLAGGIARDLRRTVRLESVAVVGARSADLDTQVALALREPADLAVIMIGTNDVTHRVTPGHAVGALGRAVRTLRSTGTVVVVGTCPDLGTVEPLMQPLRSVAAFYSRRMAAAQLVAVVENDGIAVTLGTLLSPEFAEHPHLWSADRFHPSPRGYRRVADALLPSLLVHSGVTIPVRVPVSTTVQDVGVAAEVASREPGTAVEPQPGAEGVASAGPGRLARLVRQLPLVGRGAPEARQPGSGGDEDHPEGPSQPSRNEG